MMLSSYMVAALGAYLYARRSGSSVAGAALTSLIWQGSAFLIGQIGHTNILHTAALLPWLLWAIDGYGETGNRKRGLVLAILVAVHVFAGHHQTLIYALVVATAYALVMWRARTVSDKALGARTAYLYSLIFIAAGLVLAAVQLLPTLELLRESMRSDASYDFFTSFSLPPHFLWTFFAPYVVGGGDGQLFRAPYVGPAYYAEYVGYVGLATIALAIVAVALQRDARSKFYAVVALVGLILALGWYAPFGFYKLIYAVPLLNLFRVPARHLMEVEFALAVLAGRGLTAIIAAPDRAKTLRWVAIAGGAVFVLTCLAITVGRPSNFQLGRAAPVTILRAPELFLPLVIAALSGGALWILARRRRGALALLVAVVALDLSLWGQSAGWRVASPGFDYELWSEPATVQFLRERTTRETNAAPDRILTQDQAFDPDWGVSPPAPGRGWVPSLQPDVYMMYGVENAAGYDGFGLARYSRLAGDMKIWGDLTNSKRTLQSESRELDLLNVRYLLARSRLADEAKSPVAEEANFPTATEVYAGEHFSQDNLNAPGIIAGERLSFRVPPVEVHHIALLTNLAWSETVSDSTVVAHIRLRGKDGETFNLELRAGDHTSEWAYDRPDIRSRIKHNRALVATSYEVKDAQGDYEGHTYVSILALPRKVVIDGGAITVADVAGAPRLMLTVSRVTLADDENVFPLRGEWLRKESLANVASDEREAGARWKPLAEIGKVAVFENMRTLPRAWLAAGELVATGEEELTIIRSGKIPGGASWNPLEQALVERSTGVSFGKAGEAPGEIRRVEVTRHEPNRVEVKTECAQPSLLVLSENHYPGWRAFLDDHGVKILRVNYNQRGVALPAGNHRVTFIYRPRSVQMGLVVSILALVTLSFWSFRSKT